MRLLAIAAVLSSGCICWNGGGACALATTATALTRPSEGQKLKPPTTPSNPTQVTLAQAPQSDLHARLHLTWNDDHLPYERRRELLFELWNAEAPKARAQIEAFIRGHVPAGTTIAFTPAELAAFNARRSVREPFDPYQEPRPAKIGLGFPR